ncbi:ATP-binding protein [Mycobacterium sp.]|uniref:sensor histidine kinase n=1 Tax=Mycobacterium sp. TaxID=1785 RepID=UPI0025E25141|nr:ATP-binding protein [Mycobacterium sp.]MBW0015274.1 sensor histidine kinase [Mycobacterium sp.]
MSTSDLNRVRRMHRLRSLRAGYGLRLGVVAIMIGAMLVSTDPGKWVNEGVLVALYAAIAVAAAAVVFSPRSDLVTGERFVLTLSLVDVAAVWCFKLMSPGGYLPLLLMGLLPLLVATGVSWRPTAAAMAAIYVAFAIELLGDPVIQPRIGWPETVLLLAMYAFVCSARLVVAVVRNKYEDEVASVTASREELLADTMTSSETQRRQIAEAIHDGPLQDVLAARRDISDLRKTTPAVQLDRAVSSLQEASQRLREATFELHPEVLDEVGLGAAVHKLAALTAERSGIAIATEIEYSGSNAIDPMIFGVTRELLSNVVRHSRADRASVKLAVVDDLCCLDVADNGIGITGDAAARRLAEGHIGLASHRARVEAAGGRMRIVDEPAGAHIRIEVPLRM